MTYESREEKSVVPLQGRDVVREEEEGVYCSSQTRSCIEATNLPLRVAGTEIHYRNS